MVIGAALRGSSSERGSWSGAGGSPGAPGAAERAGGCGPLLERVGAGRQRGRPVPRAQLVVADVRVRPVRVAAAVLRASGRVRLVPDRLVIPRLAGAPARPLAPAGQRH